MGGTGGFRWSREGFKHPTSTHGEFEMPGTATKAAGGEAVSEAQPAVPRTVQIDPMAALGELQALVEFYRNRCLLLANELHTMRNRQEPT
jgi:hypothetical protein